MALNTTINAPVSGQSNYKIPLQFVSTSAAKPEVDIMGSEVNVDYSTGFEFYASDPGTYTDRVLTIKNNYDKDSTKVTKKILGKITAGDYYININGKGVTVINLDGSTVGENGDTVKLTDN